MQRHDQMLVLALLLSACGGAKPAEDPSGQDPTTDDGAAPTDTSAPTESEVRWADMNRDQRMEFMGLTVLPAMKKVFVANDPVGYKEFKCQSCHGEDMQAVDYAMPNGLFALAKADPMAAGNEYDTETTKFMAEEVMPKMASLLGADPGQAFGCLNCHDAE